MTKDTGDRHGDPIPELADLPGWADLVAAGDVPPVDPQVLDRARAAVREAAARDTDERVTTAADTAADTATGTGARTPARRRRALAASMAAAAVIAAIALAASPALRSGPPSASDPASEAAPGSGPDAGGREASCAEEYSLTALQRRGLAFDGTVTKIEPTWRSARSVIKYVLVTFTVHAWYRGGRGPSATILMTPSGTSMESPEGPPYRIGTRLLVSGSSRAANPPLDLPVAWSFCGFVRPYDPQTATTWRDSLVTSHRVALENSIRSVDLGFTRRGTR